MTVAVDVLNRARQDLGYVEGKANHSKFGAWYGLPNSAWCATFVSKVFYDAGLPLPASTSKGFAYTPAGAEWFRRQKRWAGPDVKPEPGWVVFFDFPGGPRRISHVGIVESARGPRDITTIEGNTNPAGSRTGGMVARLNRRTGIVGYGIPAFTATPARPAPAAARVHEEEDDMAQYDEQLGRIESRLINLQERLKPVEKDVDYLKKEGSQRLTRSVRAIGRKLGLTVDTKGEVKP